MTHTIESLCALIGPDGNPVSNEAGDKLRIWTAEADGWRHEGSVNGEIWMWPPYFGDSCPPPPYTTSLDAIFAAEERAGIHKLRCLRGIWFVSANQILKNSLGTMKSTVDFAFFTPAQRCIPFILTRQWKEAQKP